jgi:hypothetical protein
LKSLRRLLCAAGLGLLAATATPVPWALAASSAADQGAAQAGAGPPDTAQPAVGAPATAQMAAIRVEARSADFLAVGLVEGDRMSIRLSRVSDNAPVPDAALTVLLRGVVHPTVAQADGSYTLKTKDLTIPGQAAMEFQIAEGPVHERLPADIQVTENHLPPADANGARQLGWWVLNFAVCIGFLMLLSRRRKTAAAHDDSPGD